VVYGKITGCLNVITTNAEFFYTHSFGDVSFNIASPYFQMICSKLGMKMSIVGTKLLIAAVIIIL